MRNDGASASEGCFSFANPTATIVFVFVVDADSPWASGRTAAAPLLETFLLERLRGEEGAQVR